MSRVEVQSIRTVFDDRFRVVEANLRYQRSNTQMSGFVRRLSFERGDSAAALVVDPLLRTVLLTRQFRFPTLEKGPGWPLELVAGTIEKDESPGQCIQREIFEELGYEILSLREISTFYLSPGASSERLYLYCAEIDSRSKSASEGSGSEEEDIELVAFPFAQVPALLERGEVVDAKTLIGLMWLIHERSKRPD